jgi:hypothetical protein
MGGKRLDRALAEDRAKAKGHIGGVPHFLHGGGERQRQTLTTVLGRGGDRAPAAIDPLAIGRGKACCGLDAVGFEADTFAVACFVQGREHVAGEFCAFFEHGLDQIGRQIGKITCAGQGFEANNLVQQKSHVADGGTIGHKRVFQFRRVAGLTFRRFYSILRHD